MYSRNGNLLAGKYREYILPTILTSMAVSMSNIINSIAVGQLMGSTALSAVGLASPLIYCCNAIFMLFAIGGVTCASIAQGKRDTRLANVFYTLCHIGGVLAMALLAVIVLLFAEPITKTLTAGDPALYDMTLAYIRPIGLVGMPMTLVMTTAQFMRLDGKPKMAGIVAIFANVINILLVLLFVGYLKTGIAGAAWSMVLGYTAGIIFVIRYLLTKNRAFTFIAVRVADIKSVKGIIRLGSPKALMQGFSFLRTICLNALVLIAVGSIGVAALTICVNATLLANVFVSGTGDAMLPIVGTLYGEKDKNGIRYILQSAFKILLVASIALAVFFVLTPEFVVKLFGVNDEGEIVIAAAALRIYAFSLPFYALNILMQNFYQTTGKVSLSILSTFLNTFGFAVIFAVILMKLGGNSIWFFFLCAEIATTAVVQLTALFMRRNGKYEGILMLEKESDVKTWDGSARLDGHCAADISGLINEFCSENGVDELKVQALRVAVSDKITSITGKNRKPDAWIDVILQIRSDGILVNLRCDAEFDRLSADSGKPVDTHTVDSGVTKIDTTVLGFHCFQIALS